MMESVHIDKLNGSNYSSWCDDITAVLLDRNLWNIVIDNEKPPAEGAKLAEIKDYELRVGKAFSTIYLNVDKEYRCILSGVRDGRTAWEKLKAHFRPDSRARAVGLTDEFFSSKLGEDEEIGRYAARLKSILNQLVEAGKPIPDWYQPFQLIRYLPPEYLGIVQSIYRWPDPEFTFDKVLQELIAEEARIKLSNNDRLTVALTSNIVSVPGKSESSSGKKDSKNTFQKNDKRKCFRCGKTGHLIANCKVKPQKKRVTAPEVNYMAEAAYNNVVDGKDAWVFDTAASSHFCCNKELFSEFRPVSNKNMSVAINGVTCKIEGIGKVKMIFKNKGNEVIVNLHNVLYSPRLRRNLMAGPLLDKHGAVFVGRNGKIEVFRENGEKVFVARKKDGLYFLYPKYEAKRESNNFEEVKSRKRCPVRTGNLKLWHDRYCHINSKYIVATSKNNSVRGMTGLVQTELVCEPCALAKTRRVSFKPTGKIRSTKPLELLHMDVCGPLPTQSLEGHSYFLTITDDFSRKVTVYPIRKKTDVFECFLRYQKRAERFLNSKIINVRTDNGAEFCHKEFSQFLEKQGIRAERTNTYSPEQNGVSERYNYTALDAVKAMLEASNLNKSLWAEALLCFTYVWNRVCHQGRTQTPFELFGKRKPSVKHLRKFGSLAYVGIPKQKRNKLQARAQKGVFVGYAMQTKGYRIFLPNERKVVEMFNVKIIEGEFSSRAALDPIQSSDSIFQYESDPDGNCSPEFNEDIPEVGERPDSQPILEPDEEGPELPSPDVVLCG